MNFMKDYLSREKTELWSWGRLNWQGQRFYFNWSLTLETKSCNIYIIIERKVQKRVFSFVWLYCASPLCVFIHSVTLCIPTLCFCLFGNIVHPYSVEYNLWRKTTFGGRWPLIPFMEDNIWWNTTFNGWRPLIDDDLWLMTTFDGRQMTLSMSTHCTGMGNKRQDWLGQVGRFKESDKLGTNTRRWVQK